MEVEQPGAPVEEPALIVAQEIDTPAAVEEQAPPPVAGPVKPRRKEAPAVAQAAPAVAEAAPVSEEEGDPAGVEAESAGAEGNGHLIEK